MRIKIILLILAAALLTSCTDGHETTVVIAGSTSVQPFVEKMAEEYKKIYPDKSVQVQAGGSSAGFLAVRSGIAAIGMSSRNLRGDELELWNTVIAKDGLAIIIHPENPIIDLTREELRGIYSAEITNWNELGGPDAKIHLIAREEGSGTRSAFQELVMEGLRISPRAIVLNFNGAIRQLVAGDPNAIGFISLGLVDIGERPVKAIGIDGVEASRENVLNESYPLYRSFIFVSLDEPDGPAKQFIDFVFSAEGRRILENEGLVTE
jgi:phosphate transport system substrate-binding protein